MIGNVKLIDNDRLGFGTVGDSVGVKNTGIC